MNYGVYGTYTGYIPKKEVNINFLNAEGDEIPVEFFSGKYVVLDCWYSACGYCMEEFPVIEKLHEKYNLNENVEIISLHCFMNNENHQSGYQIINSMEYHFPVLSIRIQDIWLESMGVNVYPTILIINPDGYVVFRGSLELAQIELKRLTK